MKSTVTLSLSTWLASLTFAAQADASATWQQRIEADWLLPQVGDWRDVKAKL